MRSRLLRALVALVVLAGLHLLVAPTASAHPYCGITWGSAPKAAGSLSAGRLVDVRAGRHDCYDRLVLDVGGAVLTGWSVRYVDQVRQDGSGHVVPVAGGARLQVVAGVPATPTDAWFVAPNRLVDTTGYGTFRDVVWAGSFEGMTTVGLGVRARLPFRAFVLPGPGAGSRLVVDVAHQWCATGHTC